MTARDPENAAGESPEGIDKVREAYERQKARAEAAEGKLEKQAWEKLGLSPDKGIGKALKMTYEGPIEPDTVDDITAVLQSDFDYTPPASQPAAPAEPPPPNPVSEGEKALQEAASQSTPAPIDPAADAVAQAEAEGDIAKAIELQIASSINLD